MQWLDTVPLAGTNAGRASHPLSAPLHIGPLCCVALHWLAAGPAGGGDGQQHWKTQDEVATWLCDEARSGRQVRLGLATCMHATQKAATSHVPPAHWHCACWCQLAMGRAGRWVKASCTLCLLRRWRQAKLWQEVLQPAGLVAAAAAACEQLLSGGPADKDAIFHEIAVSAVR